MASKLTNTTASGSRQASQLSPGAVAKQPGSGSHLHEKESDQSIKLLFVEMGGCEFMYIRI